MSGAPLPEWVANWTLTVILVTAATGVARQLVADRKRGPR